MIIKEEHLQVVFDQVKKVRGELIRLNGGPEIPPVSLDDLIEAIQNLYGVQIISRLVPLNSRLLRGMIEIYQNEAIITLDASLNTPDSRYVFVKEACHILLLSAENATKDPADIIEYYIHHTPTDDGPPPQIICEEVTKHGSVELLFPPALRKEAKDRIASGKDTLFTIGEWLHIPETLVEYVLRDYYIDLSNRMSGVASEPER